MSNPPLLIGLLINGVAYAAVFILIDLLVVRFTSQRIWRWFLLILLFVAAGLYVVFAARAGEGSSWLAVEALGVALFVVVGARAVHGSIWWLVGAWALHPLWDVGLHYIGPGRNFAPATYTIACLSFDLLVAVYIAVAGHRSRVVQTA